MARTPQKVTIPNQDSGLAYMNPTNRELEYVQGLEGAIDVREAAPAPVAFGSFSATRTTSDVGLGAAGVAGDFLQRVLVTTVIGTADLTISDGADVVVAVIPGASAAGTIVEVGVAAASGGFVVDLHGADAGTITAIGTFT